MLIDLKYTSVSPRSLQAQVTGGVRNPRAFSLGDRVSVKSVT
jgi:hypothetical protein